MTRFFLLAILFVSFSIVKAQENSFGFRSGVNIASLSGDNTDQLDNRVGFHFGSFAEFGLSRRFSIQPELVVSTQGVKSTTAQTLSFSLKEKINLTYLNIPVMLKFYPVEGVGLTVGPQLGLLLSAKYKVEANGDEAEEDIKELFTGTDLGLAVGVEFNMTQNLRFHGRYNFGLSNINGIDNDPAEIKNNVFQIGLGVGF